MNFDDFNTLSKAQAGSYELGLRAYMVGVFNKMGANFKRQFDIDSYKKFFADRGYENARFIVAEGRMPCAVAVIEN